MTRTSTEPPRRPTRRWLQLGLVLAALAPLAVLLWFGLRSIASLERRALELRRQERIARFGDDLGHALRDGELELVATGVEEARLAVEQHLGEQGIPPPAVVALDGVFFLAPEEGDIARVEGLAAWLEAWTEGQELPHVPSAGAAQTADVLDRPRPSTWQGPRAFRLPSEPGAATGAPPYLFEGWRPRVVLGVGVGLDLVLVLLLWRALAAQQRRRDEFLEARGELIAQVAHELRTPLTVLRLYADTLLDERVPDGTRREYLTTMRDEARRIGGLVDGVAAAARESERVDEAATPAALRPVLERVLRAYRPLIELDGGQLAADLPDAGEARVTCGGEDLRRVFEILLDNARSYGASPPRIQVDVSAAPSAVDVCVQDAGPGIPADEREAVFRKWERGSSGRGSSKRGAGMGLWIARRIAERAGGALTLEFPAAGGTRARVRLPRSGSVGEAG